MSETRKPAVLLVDGYSLIFRGFHALPLLTTENGDYTNAVHGFFSMLLKALGEYRPDALCVMLDVHAPTFRHTMYEAYKGTRKPMPEELRPQLPIVREILRLVVAGCAGFAIGQERAGDFCDSCVQVCFLQGNTSSAVG